MFRKNKTVLASLWSLGFLAASCAPSGPSGSRSGLSSSQTPLQSFAPKPSSFRLSLTDAPAKNLKSVFVNVHSAEVWIEKEGHRARLILARNVGAIDLMTLRNGVMMPLEDFEIPAGIKVEKVRLILEREGNYAVRTDDSICPLQTPSAQQSGIKIKLTNPVTIESDHSYSLVVDFDAQKSVVIKGNGGCLLKPVLKVAGFTRLPTEAVGDEGGDENTPGEDLSGGNEDSNGNAGDEDGSGDNGNDEEGWDDDSLPLPPGYEPVWPIPGF